MRGLFCLRHAPRNPTSTTRFIRPTSSCSAANQPVCRRRCTTLPMRGSSFRCRRACARSMSRWLLRWQRAKHCGSCGNVAWVERKAKPKVSSRISLPLNPGYGLDSRKNTRRVKDILTPLGAIPHPPRSLALAALTPLPNPPGKRKATSHSQIPHIRKVPRKNGKILPRVWNFWSVRMKMDLQKLTRAQLQRACKSSGTRLLVALRNSRRQRANVYESRYA